MQTTTATKQASMKPRGTKVNKSQPSTEFTFYAPEASEAYVVGEFDNWDESKNRMRKFKDGIWKKKIKLKPGRYEYKFLVDGQWHNDPDTSKTNPNPYGSENSVVEITEK